MLLTLSWLMPRAYFSLFSLREDTYEGFFTASRLHQYYEPLRHPSQPGRSFASCQLIHTAITAGTSRVAYGPLCLHAVANTPAGLMEFVRSYDSTNFGLPQNRGGSAPASLFSGPAQRSLRLRPASSPSRLCDPLHQRLQQSRCLPCCDAVGRAKPLSALQNEVVRCIF